MGGGGGGSDPVGELAEAPGGSPGTPRSSAEPQGAEGGVVDQSSTKQVSSWGMKTTSLSF